MIKINDNWGIESDGDCVTLYELKISKGEKTKGQTMKVSPRYYPNLETTLTSLIDIDIQKDNFQSIELVVEKIKNLKSDILEALAKLKNASETT